MKEGNWGKKNIERWSEKRVKRVDDSYGRGRRIPKRYLGKPIMLRREEERQNTRAEKGGRKL